MGAEGANFESVQERLNQIVDEVSAEDISLDDALKLYEEAVKLGLAACDLSEADLEAAVGQGEGSAQEVPPETAEPVREPVADDAPYPGDDLG